MTLIIAASSFSLLEQHAILRNLNQYSMLPEQLADVHASDQDINTDETVPSRVNR